MLKIVLVALAALVVGSTAGYFLGPVQGYNPLESALVGGFILVALWCYIIIEKNS